MSARKTARLVIAMQEIKTALLDAFMSAVEDAIICEELPPLSEKPLDPIDDIVGDVVTDLELLDPEEDVAEAVEKGVAKVLEVWRTAYGPSRGSAH